MTNQPPADPAALAQQVLAAANSLSDEEAARRYQQILAQLPREEAAQLNALALSQVAPDQRRVLASGLKAASQDPARPFDGYKDDDDDDNAATPQRLGQLTAQAARQDPELTNNLLGEGNSALGGQIGRAALAALAALLIQRLMSGQGQQGQQAQAGGLDVGSILGGLLGGATGGQQPQAGGLDVGSILGGLLGGQQPQAGSRQAQTGGGLDVGSILGGLLGGATGGQQPQAGGLDLGSILGGLLGGATGGQQPQASGQQAQAGGPDLGSILGSILSGGTGSGPSYRKD